MADEPADVSRLLGELESLAGVEHALVVECLTVQCALGHDLEGSDAASAALNLAVRLMSSLRNLHRALADSGRRPKLTRAADVGGVSLALPQQADLERLLEREARIFIAVDSRYGALRAAVASTFTGDLLAAWDGVLDNDPTHLSMLDDLTFALGGQPPVLCATRRTPNDAFEKQLSAIADQTYATVLSAVDGLFDPDSGWELRGFATQTAMNALNEINRILVGRELLPAFSIRP